MRQRTIPPTMAKRLTILLLFGCLAVPGEGASSIHKADSDQKPTAPANDLFNASVVPRVRIEISREGMSTLRQYRWQWGGNSWERTNVLGTVREAGMIYTNVAIHLKGGAGSFRTIDQKPALTLNFDRDAGGQRFHGLQKIHLNNSVQDPSYLCEQIAREMFTAAGVPAPRAANARVELNGHDLGAYVLVEGWNKQFLKQHFKNAKGNLYDGGFAKDITYPLELNSGERPGDRSDLQALAAAAREPDTNRRWQRLDQVLDLDRFISFVAMEVMLAHWDGYALNRNNYRLYHDPDSDRMIFLPHGLDQLFGVWRATPTSPINPSMRGLVAQAVVQAREGRRRYLERMSELLTNVYQVQALTNRVQELARKLAPVFADDAEAAQEHQREVTLLCERIERRARSIREQLTAPSAPLNFDSSGTVTLAGWKSKTDAGIPVYARRKGSGGKELLQISALRGLAYGSWRTRALIEDGQYQFTGRIKTQDVTINPDDTRGGAGLRISGGKIPEALSGDHEWTTFLYEFEVTGIADVEFVCELRATKGEAWFDPESLKLIRKK